MTVPDFIHAPTPGPAIYCIWHNRLALCMPAYFDYVRKRNQTPGMAAMVSASRDGGFLTGILECFNVQPVRGSSSRRGPQALLELTTWAERGYDLAITPDGPRGPRYVVQDGVMSLAQLTGLPIVPVSYHVNWKISREKLGSVSDSAAVLALRNAFRKSRFSSRARRRTPSASNCAGSSKPNCAPSRAIET